MVDREVEQRANGSETVDRDLVELSRKTGLVVRRPDSAAMKRLFAKLEEYDSQERAETFKVLESALNETRSSPAADPTSENEKDYRTWDLMRRRNVGFDQRVFS